jgi:hypothetical protein
LENIDIHGVAKTLNAIGVSHSGTEQGILDEERLEAQILGSEVRGKHASGGTQPAQKHRIASGVVQLSFELSVIEGIGEVLHDPDVVGRNLNRGIVGKPLGIERWAT